MAVALLLHGAGEDTAKASLVLVADTDATVLVDGAVWGARDGEGIVGELEPGFHRVLVTREGFEAQHLVVEARARKRATQVLNGWQPKASGRRASRAHGSLAIYTTPLDLTISSQKLGWTKIQKRRERWIARGVPEGTYKLTFCTEIACIDRDVAIRRERTTALAVQFDSANVVEITDGLGRDLARARKECVATRSRRSCVDACAFDGDFAPRSRIRSCEILATLDDARGLASTATSSIGGVPTEASSKRVIP